MRESISLWPPGPERRVHLFRALCALLLGGVPAAVTVFALPGGLAAAGAGLPRPIEGLIFAVLLAAVAAPVTVLSVKKPGSWTQYPQIQSASWDSGLWLRNAATWALYLAPYEFFFRGFLIFGLQPSVGAWPAVFISTSLYVFAHMHKDPKEAAACVPMGLLFGAGSLWTGSFWPSFAAHYAIALISETAVVRANPAIAWRRADVA